MSGTLLKNERDENFVKKIDEITQTVILWPFGGKHSVEWGIGEDYKSRY